MTKTELLAALRRLKVETSSLACLGCGHEHNCGIHGCAILREAEAYIRGVDRVVGPYEEEAGDICRGERPCPPLNVGGYIRAGKNIEEAKRELAKQEAQCVEQMMLANDMFFVEGDKVSWRLRIYAEEEGDGT